MKRRGVKTRRERRESGLSLEDGDGDGDVDDLGECAEAFEFSPGDRREHSFADEEAAIVTEGV